MAVYPKKVELRAFSPRMSGEGDEAAACGRSASFVCGCYVSFSLKNVDDEIAASFTSNGCGYMVAVADILAGTVAGKAVSELHGLDRSELMTAVEGELGVLPSTREHCAEVCFEALRNAFVALRERRIGEFRGDEALICTCFGISERFLDDFITSNRNASVESIADSCRAGSGCGSCRMLIQEMLENAAAMYV